MSFRYSNHAAEQMLIIIIIMQPSFPGRLFSLCKLQVWWSYCENNIWVELCDYIPLGWVSPWFEDTEAIYPLAQLSHIQSAKNNSGDVNDLGHRPFTVN